MNQHREQRVFPYTAEQMFDLVADVQRYPDFLPGWSDARVTRRDGHSLCADQTVGIAPLRYRFSTEAVLERPQRIHVAATDGPFAAFDIDWRFAPHSVGHCSVVVTVNVHPRSHTLGELMETVFQRSTMPLLTAFARRARQVYGGP